jgi:hypothetical protein
MMAMPMPRMNRPPLSWPVEAADEITATPTMMTTAPQNMAFRRPSLSERMAATGAATIEPLDNNVFISKRTTRHHLLLKLTWCRGRR